jgi:diguanylate cyclase (GGDEF)-like protein
MSHRATQPQLERPEDREIALRLSTVRVGIYLTAWVTAGALAYALLTWERPNRDVLIGLNAIALLSLLVIALLPMERVVRGPWREPFFVGWSGLYVVMVAVGAAADGGITSPFALMFVLPLIFGSLSYPLSGTIVVGAIDMLAYLSVAAYSGDSLRLSLAGAFALASAAVLCSWLARNQAARRSHLTRTAEALQSTEETSRLLAHQQREVASFGQLALEGADVDRLCQEAVEIVERILGVEMVAILEHLPDENAFSIRAGVGLPEEDMLGRVPAGKGSQAGYTLTAGEPVIVADWSEETRFAQARILRDAGATSGINALIRTTGHSFGVVGAQTRIRRDFGPDDVSFLQSIANVLANAVERRTTEERTRHEAVHDPLTALPNRTLFLDRLEHALAQSTRRGSSVAVLFLDLDQFKLVNDSLGHAAGDDLLGAVGLRFEQALRPEDTVARFGGDEFAVLVEDVAGEWDATRVAERLTKSLARPFILRRREHFVSASIGISISAGGESPETLIRDADAALYRAKERGRGGYEIFDAVMRARVVEHMQLENDLRRAFDRSELELHYQPVVSLRTGSVTTLEALIRWRHPERGLIHPAGFLDAAEDSQLILPIGRRSIAEACRAASGWQELHPDEPPTRVAINLSARQLTDPELPRTLEAAIESSRIEPVTVELEMTETALLEETEDPEGCLRKLKEIGVRVVLDDFGTGFSSLGYLRRFPLDAIKLDRSFVEHLTEGSTDATIVRAVVEMAAALGLDVVAEGVETEDQLAAVRALGCDHAQGFYFARPLPAREAAGIIGDRPWSAAVPRPVGDPG